MAKKKDAFDYVQRYLEPGGDQAERRPLEQNWFLDLAYYSGNVNVVAEDGTIRRPKRLSRGRSHYSANLVAPAVLRNVALLMGVNMDFRTAPKSADFRDRHASMVADKIWEHLQDGQKFQRKKFHALLWSAITGIGWFKVSWDDQAGDSFRAYYREDGQPVTPGERMLEDEAEAAGRFRDHFEGDVAIELPNPFQMHWDWNAREGGVDDAMWLSQVQSVSIDRLVDEFGSSVRTKVQPDETDQGALRYQEAIASLTSNGLGLNFGASPTHARSENTRQIEWFERPQRKNQWKGRYILCAGGHVLRDEANPYLEFGSPLPFVRVPWWDVPGRFAPMGLVGQLRNPQRAYNRSRSHQQDVERTNGFPVTILPKSAGVKPKKMTSYPGLILEVETQAAGLVHHLPPPNLPAYVGDNANRAQGELSGIAAQASPTKDSYPSQVRSSLAIQAMQQDRNSILSPTSEMFALAVLEVGRHSLRIANRMYKLPRLIRTIGRGNEFEVEMFSSSDMRGNTDLKMFGEPARLETSTAEQERVLQMIEIGAVDPRDPSTRSTVLMALDSKNADALLDDMIQDERNEEKWLKRMIERPDMESPPPILPGYNAQVRIRVLERFIKRDDFWEVSEETRMLVLERHEQFSQMIQAQMQAELEMQMMMSGSQKSETGTPSAPKRSGANA